VSSSTTRTGDGVSFRYDYLILATGASHSYFGHNEFEKHAPGLKSLADAVAIRIVLVP
jgi:NADH dehydrogenase